MNQITPGADFAAECHGIRVPNSPFLHDKRIERINAAAYEGDEIAGALSVVRKGDRVLELGAGLGIVGAVVAARAEPERVLSFEANPALIRHIRRLHRINGLTRRIELRNEVLVGPEETRTTLPFHIRSSYLGSSLHSTGRAAETVNVVTAPLGEVMEELRPDVMLIDIEGGEREILKAADLSGVRALVVEFHPEVYGRDGMAELKKLLTEAGFQRDPEHSSRRVWTCRRPH